MASPEETETAGDIYKERLNKVDTTDLKANWEKSEAVAQHQESPKEEAARGNISSIGFTSILWVLKVETGFALPTNLILTETKAYIFLYPVS
jgi:hypothetical protein